MMELIRTMLSRHLRSTNRFMLVFFLSCFFWMLYVIKIQLDFQKQQPDKDRLRERIIKLSKEYVDIIAKERSESSFGIDGQTTVELQDLRRTTAILLQNMLDRLQVLERQVEDVISQSAWDITQLSEQLKSLNQSIRRFNVSQGLTMFHCNIPNDPVYPECAAKVKWLAGHWKTNVKYSQNGVNGSICSFLHYLSEVENFCPSRTRASSNFKDCQIPNNDHYPECENRIKWLLKFWRSNAKYSAKGVDGSVCSIVVYLSEVESFCPLLPGRNKINEGDCKVPMAPKYPHCSAKVAWMQSSWKTDKCYAEDYGVNGTICSFLSYLSEVESWCPMFPGRRAILAQKSKESREKVDIGSTSVTRLIDKLTDVIEESRLSWIRYRATRLYSYWEDALRELGTRVNVTQQSRKKVVIHIGVLAEEKNLHFAATAGKGGPLGELVQWCDLISSLYVLGHDIRVSVDHQEFLSALNGNGKRSCPPKDRSHLSDLIFTDYYGLKYLKSKGSSLLEVNKCKLRIVDSFGTEALFNFNGPLPKYTGVPGGVSTVSNSFGKNNLNLKQYMTMFPHSPDNTFLGFVVDSAKNVPKSVSKKPQALAYGKHYNMWGDLKDRRFLDVIHEHFEIHATTGGMPLGAVKQYLPDYVINHGVVSASKLQEILRESKIFIGIGFPYEGPAPLEAIAQGCLFINPKFIPPKNRINTKFFSGKPTFRSLTSQHPYAEEFIGEPRVLTVDINDLDAVRTAVKKIAESQPSPYLPFEYSHEGMLERVNALVHNQDFCNPEAKWPPLKSRKVIFGKKGESCKDVCLRKGLVCEPAYFESINNPKFLKKASFPCVGDKIVTRPSLVAPAHVAEEDRCVLQANPALYSCTVSHHSIRRVCPCRDYRKGQVALCKTCY